MKRIWLAADIAAEQPAGAEQSGVLLTLSGQGILSAPAVLAGIDGVTGIHQLDDDPD